MLTLGFSDRGGKGIEEGYIHADAEPAELPNHREGVMIHPGNVVRVRAAGGVVDAAEQNHVGVVFDFGSRGRGGHGWMWEIAMMTRQRYFKVEMAMADSRAMDGSVAPSQRAVSNCSCAGVSNSVSKS